MKIIRAVFEVTYCSADEFAANQVLPERRDEVLDSTKRYSR